MKKQLEKMKIKIKIASNYVKLMSVYLCEKGLKEDFEKFCEEKLGKAVVVNDKENLI